MRFDHLVHVGLPGVEEFLGRLRRGGAGGALLFGAGQLRGFAEAGRGPQGVNLVKQIADRRVGRETRGGVGLTAFGGNPELVDRAFLALLFRGPLHELLGLTGGIGHALDFTMAFDGKALDRLAGFGNAVDHAAGPARLDADDDDRGHIGIAAGTDQGAKVQLQIFAELQPPIVVRQSHAALDVVRHLFASGVGKVIEGQNHHVVANADAPVLPAVAHEGMLAHLTTSWS